MSALKVFILLSALLLLAIILGPCQAKKHKPSCAVRTNGSLAECYQGFRKEMRKDLSDDEECCILAEQNHCVKVAYESHCADEAEEYYHTWRLAFRGNHTEVADRCLDYAHDTFQCFYLNNVALAFTIFICSLLGFVIFVAVGVYFVFRQRRKRDGSNFQ